MAQRTSTMNANRGMDHEINADVRRSLQRIPNVGPAVAADLMRLGITGLADLKGRDPDALYAHLCAMDGVRHDPCMHDTFAAVIAYANGEPAQPWWMFSRRRKARERSEGGVGNG